MLRRDFLRLSVLGPLGVGLRPFRINAAGQAPTRKILIAGGGFDTAFIRYMATLTGKPRPKLLYLPTASADSQTGIIAWFRSCAPLDVEPLVQDSFIASTRQTQTGRRCSSRSTASSAPAATRSTSRRSGRRRASTSSSARRGIAASCSAARARDRSAGSRKGTTDSRPKELTTVKCLGFLKGSHSPHYDREPDRRPLYQKLIAVGPDEAGLRLRQRRGHLLRGQRGQARRVVPRGGEGVLRQRVGGEAVEKVLEPEMIA